MHQFEQEGSHVVVIADHSERLARARRNAGSAGEQDKFLPEVEKHVLGQRDIDVGTLHLLHMAGKDPIPAPVQPAAANARN
jgi:hypothetical protein